MKWLIILTILLFVALGVIVVNLPPREMTMKDLHPVIVPAARQQVIGTPDTSSPFMRETPVRTVQEGTYLNDPLKQKAVLLDEGQIEYYIIIESIRDRAMAKGKAEALKKQYKADIIVLSQTADGNFRLSYGKYSSYEEASSVITRVRKKIREDAWIYSAAVSVMNSGAAK